MSAPEQEEGEIGQTARTHQRRYNYFSEFYFSLLNAKQQRTLREFALHTQNKKKRIGFENRHIIECPDQLFFLK